MQSFRDAFFKPFPCTLAIVALVKWVSPHAHKHCRKPTLRNHLPHVMQDFTWIFYSSGGGFLVVKIHLGGLLFRAGGDIQFKLSIPRAICMQICELHHTWASAGSQQDSECWFKLSENELTSGKLTSFHCVQWNLINLSLRAPHIFARIIWRFELSEAVLQCKMTCCISSPHIKYALAYTDVEWWL